MKTNSDDFTKRIAVELRVSVARVDGGGPSNSAISRAVGVSPMAVGRYLNGERAIPLPTFVAICAAIGVSPGDVLDAATAAK